MCLLVRAEQAPKAGKTKWVVGMPCQCSRSSDCHGTGSRRTQDCPACGRARDGVRMGVLEPEGTWLVGRHDGHGGRCPYSQLVGSD